MKAVRQLSPIHRMAPWLRTYGSYQGRECSTRPCHGSGYAHSALEHSQLTYGDAIGMSGMQLLWCWYCAISLSCPTPPAARLSVHSDLTKWQPAYMRLPLLHNTTSHTHNTPVHNTYLINALGCHPTQCEAHK